MRGAGREVSPYRDSDKLVPGDKAPQRKGTAIRDSRAWDEAMVKAKAQAETYARALPPEEGRPPFLLVADIGYQIDVYADFSGTGVYVPFPSARNNRLSIDDLRRDEVLARLKAIWTDPLSLDPSRENEKVTTDAYSLSLQRTPDYYPAIRSSPLCALCGTIPKAFLLPSVPFGAICRQWKGLFDEPTALPLAASQLETKSSLCQAKHPSCASSSPKE